MVQNLKWATAHLSRRRGRWAGVGVGGRAGRWAQVRVAGVRTSSQGVLALGVGAGARAAGERQRRWGTQAAEASRRWDAQAGARQGERAHGLGRQRRAGSAGARGRSRQGRAGRPAGRPVRVWCAQLGQVGCFGAPNSVFGLV